MAFRKVIGEVTKGRGAGLRLYAVDSDFNSRIFKSDYPYNNTEEIDSIAFGKEEGFFSKYVEKECLNVDEVTEVKKLTEAGNDVYLQFTYSNGEVSAVKTWTNLRISDKCVVHPVSTITELFITKFVG